MEMRSTTSSFDLDEPFVCQADKATGSVCDGNDVQPELPSVISVTGRPGSLRIRIKVPPRHIQAAADSNRKKRPRPGTPRYSGQEDSSRPSSRSGGRRRHSSSKQNKRHCSSPDSRSDALVDRHHHVERYLDSSGEQAYQRLRAAFMNFCLVRERQAGAAWARCDYWGFEISDEAAAEHMAEYTQAVKGAGCLSPVTRRVLRRSLDAEWNSLRQIRCLRCGRGGILSGPLSYDYRSGTKSSVTTHRVRVAHELHRPPGPGYS
mmetsp:Transcript_1959/g.5758  ORF Transcript_1959/g.5758 Transcript_1959/m.5758 type:complete len:262 (-) Transcript_1959:634-1419(-)